MALSKTKMGAVEVVMQSASDALLMRLNAALSAARTNDPVFIPVSDIARAEAEDRRVRDMVLKPLTPMTNSAPQLPLQAQLAPSELSRIWRLMKALDPAQVAAAAQAGRFLRVDEPSPPVFDDLCRLAAAALADQPPGEFATSWPSADRVRVSRLLCMTPALRVALSKLAGLMREVSEDRKAAMRVIFKDVTAADADAGSLFLEVLAFHVEEPSQILRVISAVVEQPTDRYLASSELAGLGERLLDDIDRRVSALRTFDPSRGSEGGAAQAASVFNASCSIKEFEQWLKMTKEGPWGARIAVQKQGLVEGVEARLREVEPAVAAALPVQSARMSGARGARSEPRIDGYPDDNLVRRADGLLAFLDEIRTSAASAGFSALRTKTVEAVEQRIETYVRDLLERLHHDGGGGDGDWIRAYLEVAASFSGAILGPQSAQIVRRRAAAA